MKKNLHLLITVTILLCFPKASFGLTTPPDLGRASGFTIFTDAGAINNIGASVVTGDVGNVTGAYDFTGGTINGTHFVTGSPETVAAKTDLDLAYGYISTLSGSVIGVDMVTATLTPGIYQTGAEATLNGTLTLDGQGDTSALFIIKIGGKFSTGTGASVKLINGASMSNVFWQVQGAFALGDNTKFIGNVLAGGAISLLEGSSLQGRALSVEGAISLHNNNVSNAEPCVPVTISTQPLDLALCAGTGTPSFTLIASGDGPITYQWQYLNAGVWNNVADGIPTNALYTTATTVTLGISGITAPGTYSYKSILTNCLGTNTVTSNTVTLTINPVPIITDKIRSILTGESFSVTPTGVPAGTTYTWPAPLYTGGVTGGSEQPIAQTTISQILSIPSGTGTAIYTVTPSSGSCNGNPFKVTVNVSALCVPVSIDTQPSDTTLCTGTGNPSFTLDAGGSGPYTYQWQYENAGVWSNVLNGIPTNALYTNANTATLDISGITEAGTYSYKNILTNCLGTNTVTSNTVTLTINPVPNPTDQTTSITTGETFNVTPSGVPAGTTYTWLAPVYTGGVTGGSAQPIPKATISQLLTIPSGTGTATYIVTPSSGFCNGNPFNVTVNVSASCVPVSIGTQPSDLALCTGTGNPSFTLVAAGDGPFTYQWQYLDAGVWNNVVDGIPTNALYATANTETLGISGITTPGTYSYKNILTNCLGANTVTSDTVTLTINPNTGTPVFTAGNTILCQDSPDETYLATATNSTSIVYSVLPASAGIMNGSTGVMDWDAAFSGTATVTATATGLCDTTSIDLLVTVNPLPLAAGIITGAIKACQTETGVAFSVASIPNATDYIWTLPAGATIASGANTNSITVDFDANAVSGNITVQGSNGCGVGAVSSAFAITVRITLVALASSNSPVCEGSSINLTAQTQVGGVYIWTGPNGFASNVQNPVIPNATAAQAGVYKLVVWTSCYCCESDSSIVPVVVNNCNVSDLSITMTVDNIHPFMGRNVEFAVTATNQGPDKATGVRVSNLLPDGYTYVSSTTSVSSYDSNTGFWDIGTLNQGESERMTIIATANTTGNYTNTATVTGIEADGDLTNNVASVTTIPTDFFIPEGFSPNGDGINDLFVIRGIQNYPANKIVIYNRWGNKVFEASPYLNNWDGQATTGLRINGNDLPTGTYFYLLDLGDGTDMIKGTIYLNQ